MKSFKNVPNLFLISLLFSQLCLADKNKSELTSEFIKKFNFSKALTPKTEFLGFIEPKYRRLKIKFISVSQSASDPGTYLVKGTSTVKDNSCNFSGTIQVDEIEKTKMHYGVDDEFKGAGIKSEGVFHGNYEFAEDKNQKFSGIFKGTMVLFWYVDKDGKIQYDDIESSYSDNFKNNQYAGTWTKYDSKVGKIANWGEYRIPNSGDLDIGAAEFGANPKYEDQGW